MKKLNILPQNPESIDQESTEKAVGPGRFPSWLHRKLPPGNQLKKTGLALSEKRLHTVCEEARCPNLLECWSKKTATFLVMGKECTRNCGFCSIDFSKTPKKLEEDEPLRVADAVKQLGLKHVVITMVARDDLEDGGASHLVKVIEEVRKTCPESTIEVLTSDFQGSFNAIDSVIAARPEIFNHNLETVEPLTPRVRHKATYQRSLELLAYVRKNAHPKMLIKSGMMLGLGENDEEVKKSLHDLKEAGVDVVTLGQYLQADVKKLLVKSFVHPDKFKEFADYGHLIGIRHVYAAPFVRSSYNAEEIIQKLK